MTVLEHQLGLFRNSLAKMLSPLVEEKKRKTAASGGGIQKI